jgi:uracil-DNA glycosylase family 4
MTSLVEAKDLDGYWRTLETEYPRWFPGTRTVAQALGHAAPRLAVVELVPSAEGVFAGDAGALLDRMMIAIGVTRDQLYLTSLMKSAPATSKTWARKDTARMVPVLMRELQLAQCGLVLVMGEACAQALLKTGRSIPDLLKSPVETDGLSLSATWHPAEIRAGDAEATPATADAKPARPRATQAWDHLQWLRGLLPAR